MQAADETPVSAAVMIVRTPGERLTFLQAIASGRKHAIAGGLPGLLAGTLIADGYSAAAHDLTALDAIEVSPG